MSILAYMAEQPGVIHASIGAARADAELWSKPGGCLHLVGSGSSRNAIVVSISRFAAGGWRPVLAHGPRQFVADCRAGRISRGQVVVLSQSGASVTSVEAAEVARAAGFNVLAITAEAASPLARLGVPLLVLPVGPEPIGPKTKGFTACVGALLALAGVAGEPGPSLAAALEAGRGWAERLLDRADAADTILITGAGPLDGIALEASLKIAEIAGAPAASFPWEEVLHGRLHGLTSRSLCIVLGDPEIAAEATRAREAMRKRGIEIEILPPASGMDTPWTPLAAILPFQWLAVRLAERRSMSPEAMRYPGLSADLAIKVSPGR
jgi:fructoselysine-6-P-deglycase FrlB-like protein